MKLFIFPCLIILITISGYTQNNNQAKSLHSDSIDVINYSINLEITDFAGKVINGFTILTITPKVDNLDVVTLDLLGLNVDSVYFFDSVQSVNYSYNDTLLNIPLSPTASVTDTFHVMVYYHGIPCIESGNWGGFYFQSNVAYNIGIALNDYPHNFGKVWFPCVDDFIDRAKYDYFITVTADKMAVCSGILQSSSYNTDSTKITYHWKLENEIPAYLASVAVGKYVNLSSDYPGIIDTIPVEIYANPSDTTDVIHSFTNLFSALHIFESRFGPYQWQRVGYVIVPFDAGGMEHATNILYSHFMADGSLYYESFLVHELSHHWFGDLVTCRTDEDMWLNEGWARYCEFIFEEYHYGISSANDQLQLFHRENLRYLHIEDGGYLPVYGIPHNMTYCNTVYDKGADVAHTLRGYLGDSLFFNGISSFLQAKAFTNVTTEDLKNFLATYSGINLDDFFDAWVYSPGWPHFSIDSVISAPNGNNFDVTVYIRQKLKGCSQPANSNKLELTFIDQYWNRITKIISFSGESGNSTYSLPFNPVCTFPDFENKVSDAITDNFKIINTAGTYDFKNTYFLAVVNSITDSVMIRAEHNWVSPDPLVVPDLNLTLSGERYWKIDGIIPTGNIIQAKFSYSRSISGNDGYLDNGLLNDSVSADSLVVMYRENTSHDWKIINSVKQGTFVRGKMAVDTLKTGEYCLAIRNRSLGSYLVQNENKIRIFPNPSNGNVTIEWKNIEAGCLKIIDINGKEVISKKFPYSQNSFTWLNNGNHSGTYVVKLTGNNRTIAEEKLVLQ